MPRKIGSLFAAKLLQHLLELSFQHRDRMISSFCPQGTYTIHKRPSQEGKLGTTGQGIRNIRAGADAAIHHDFNFPFVRLYDGQQGLYR